MAEKIIEKMIQTKENENIRSIHNSLFSSNYDLNVFLDKENLYDLFTKVESAILKKIKHEFLNINNNRYLFKITFNCFIGNIEIPMSILLIPDKMDEKGFVLSGRIDMDIGYKNEFHDIELYEKDSKVYYAYNHNVSNWTKFKIPVLTEGELNVLLLSHIGFSSKQIADKLFLSSEAVKARKRQVCRKFNVKTMAQAILAYKDLKKIQALLE